MTDQEINYHTWTNEELLQKLFSLVEVDPERSCVGFSILYHEALRRMTK